MYWLAHSTSQQGLLKLQVDIHGLSCNAAVIHTPRNANVAILAPAAGVRHLSERLLAHQLCGTKQFSHAGLKALMLAHQYVDQVLRTSLQHSKDC